MNNDPDSRSRGMHVTFLFALFLRLMYVFLHALAVVAVGIVPMQYEQWERPKPKTGSANMHNGIARDA